MRCPIRVLVGYKSGDTFDFGFEPTLIYHRNPPLRVCWSRKSGFAFIPSLYSIPFREGRHGYSLKGIRRTVTGRGVYLQFSEAPSSLAYLQLSHPNNWL